MEIWVMIIWISGAGHFVEVAPFEYQSREACVVAAEQMDEQRLSWACLPGPKS